MAGKQWVPDLWTCFPHPWRKLAYTHKLALWCSSMSTERIILKFPIRDSLLNPLDFLVLNTFYNTWNCHHYCTPANWTFSTTAWKAFVLWNWKESPLWSIVSNVCQFLLKEQDDPPPWVAENWTTHPLPRAHQNLMAYPLSAPPTPVPNTFWQVCCYYLVMSGYSHYQQNDTTSLSRYVLLFFFRYVLMSLCR